MRQQNFGKKKRKEGPEQGGHGGHGGGMKSKRPKH
jgi:hypothetical protein